MKFKGFNKSIVYIAVILIVAGFILFNDYGVIKYYSLKGDIERINEDISEAEKKIDQLRLEIDSLKNNSFKKEKVAREKYHMVREGEKVIRVEER